MRLTKLCAGGVNHKSSAFLTGGLYSLASWINHFSMGP